MAARSDVVPSARVLSPTWGLGAAAVAGILASSAVLQAWFAPPRQALRFTPPVPYLELVCGSFRSLCADVFYMRGVQAIGEDFQDREAWVDWVQTNFEVATRLDPKLTQAYFFAGVVIARDEPSIRKGIEFLQRGRERAPWAWQLPYWIGLNSYYVGDYLNAAAHYEQASRLPEAPAFLRTGQPMLYYLAGRTDLGVLSLEGLRRSVREPRQLEGIELKLRWLRDITRLEERVGMFRARYSRMPRELEELVDVGLLEAIPDDPFGRGFYFDAERARVRSRFKP